MNETDARIEEPAIERDASGRIKLVSLVFGPHHFVDVYVEGGRVHCSIGATHHGIRADAADVNGEFEQLIDALKRAHPEKSF